VSWLLPLHASALFLATGLSIWAAVFARARRTVPGSPAFGWLMLAVAHWCLMSGLHTLAPDTASRIIIAKVQYLSVSGIGVLWLLFTSGYARVAWPSHPAIRTALWALPVLTVVAALTNEAHGFIWRDISLITTPWGFRLVYQPGPWYWIHVAYTYALVLIGAWMLAQGVAHFPPPYRPQIVAVALGLVVPIVSNIAYLAYLRPIGGFDVTPLAFAVAGLSFTWGLYRYRLFGLVPLARDMVVDSMEDGVLVLDAERRIIDLNLAAERHTGCTAASVGLGIAQAVSWWTQATAEGRASAELPAVVKVEPGPASSRCACCPCARPSGGSRAGWSPCATSRRGGASRPIATHSSAACRNSRSPRASRCSPPAWRTTSTTCSPASSATPICSPCRRRPIRRSGAPPRPLSSARSGRRTWCRRCSRMPAKAGSCPSAWTSTRWCARWWT